MANHGTQGDPQGRVVCANCHANNFAGQAQCWQCHASLVTAGVGHSVANRPLTAEQQVAAPVSHLPSSGSERTPAARPSALLLVGIGMMAFVAVLMLTKRSPGGTPGVEHAAMVKPGPDTAATPGATKASVPGASDELPAPDTASNGSTGQPAVTTNPTFTGGDPLEDAARRTISREAPNVGVPPSGAVSSDGQVHLRSGGSISVEEWNEAKRKLQDNPLLKEPPPPPPF